MPDYSKANIYQLCCKDPEITDIYIGSSCNLTRRKHKHKSDCNNEKSVVYNTYVYRFIRNHGNFQNWDLIRLENFSCEDKHELRKKEREWIEKLKPTLNTSLPNRSWEEYRKTKKYKKYQKDYREKNKKKANEYGEKYKKLKTTCFCGSNIKLKGLSAHRKTKKHRILVSKIKKDLNNELKKIFMYNK